MEKISKLEDFLGRDSCCQPSAQSALAKANSFVNEKETNNKADDEQSKIKFKDSSDLLSKGTENVEPVGAGEVLNVKGEISKNNKPEPKPAKKLTAKERLLMRARNRPIREVKKSAKEDMRTTPLRNNALTFMSTPPFEQTSKLNPQMSWTNTGKTAGPGNYPAGVRKTGVIKFEKNEASSYPSLTGKNTQLDVSTESNILEKKLTKEKEKGTVHLPYAHVPFPGYNGVTVKEGLDFVQFSKAVKLWSPAGKIRPLQNNNLLQHFVQYLKECRGNIIARRMNAVHYLDYKDKCYYFAGKRIDGVFKLSFSEFENKMSQYFRTTGYKQLEKEKGFKTIKDKNLYLAILYVWGVSNYGGEVCTKGNQIPFRKMVPLEKTIPKDISTDKTLIFINEVTIECKLHSPGYFGFDSFIKNIQPVNEVGFLRYSATKNKKFNFFGYRNTSDMFAGAIGPFPDPDLVRWAMEEGYISECGKKKLSRIMSLTKCKSCTKTEICKCMPLRVFIFASECADKKDCCKLKLSIYFNTAYDDKVIFKKKEKFKGLLKALFPSTGFQQPVKNSDHFDYDESLDETYTPSSDEESEDEFCEETLKIGTHEEPPHIGGILTRMKRKKSGAPKPHNLHGSLFFQNNDPENLHRSLCASFPVVPLIETMEEKQAGLEGRSLLLEMHMKGLFFASQSNDKENGAKLLKRLNHYGYAPAKQPPGLSASLRDYQKQDLQFMIDTELGDGGLNRYLWAPIYTKEGKISLWVSPLLKKFTTKLQAPLRGGFLCDEMGLGKTVVTLSLVISNPADPVWLAGKVDTALKSVNLGKKNRAEKRAKGTLVVCHVSLVAQWISEAMKMSDGKLKILKYYGTNRKQDLEALCDHDVVVTTYQVFVSDHMKRGPGQKVLDARDYIPPLERVHWWRIVLDESHSMQSGTERSHAITSSLESKYKWCVTGTPMNKDLSEIYQQLCFLGVTERLNISKKELAELPSRVVFRVLQSCMIRHEKLQPWFGANVLKLPDKLEKTVYVNFSKEEQSLYDIESASTIERWKGMMKSSTLAVRALLGELRMICSMGEANRKELKKLLNQAKDASISDTPSDAQTLKRKLNPGNADGPKAKKPTITGADFVKQMEPQLCSKFSAILNQLSSDLSKLEYNSPNKVLIFTEYRETLEVLSKLMNKEGINHVTLHGSTAMQHRKSSLERFESDNTCNVFLASIRAAGVGINIMAANKIYLVEPSENAALERQAIGRCWRLGQCRPVAITRFVCQGSIEEMVLELRDQTPKVYPYLTKGQNAYVHVGKHLGLNNDDMEHVFQKSKNREHNQRIKQQKQKEQEENRERIRRLEAQQEMEQQRRRNIEQQRLKRINTLQALQNFRNNRFNRFN